MVFFNPHPAENYRPHDIEGYCREQLSYGTLAQRWRLMIGPSSFMVCSRIVPDIGLFQPLTRMVPFHGLSYRRGFLFEHDSLDRLV